MIYRAIRNLIISSKVTEILLNVGFIGLNLLIITPLIQQTPINVA